MSHSRRRPSYTVIRQARENASGYHVQEISRRNATESQVAADIKSCCAATVTIGEPECPTSIGVIYCDTRCDEGGFTESDAIFLKQLATQFSSYVELALQKRRSNFLESQHQAGIKEKNENPDVVLAKVVGYRRPCRNCGRTLSEWLRTIFRS